jgi:hypothetical protein
MNRRKAIVAAAALAAPLAVEFYEISEGPDGWPYSRYIRLIPLPLRILLLAILTFWGWPHLIRDTRKLLELS